MNRSNLYIIAALTWGLPGIMITTEGISAYCTLPTHCLWWLLIITICILTAFFFIFRAIVDKYSVRISRLPQKTTIFQTFPPRGWFLLCFMAGLGVTLNMMPELPTEFTASFYSGLGPMLIFSAGRFTLNGKRNHPA